METRVLPAEPSNDLQAYLDGGGGRGLDAAERLGIEGVIEDLAASGLRGRGGAGFPTGLKWRTVAEMDPSATAPTVVVNGAEGEPGSFKDRMLLRTNPFAVLEGAAIAARLLGAARVVVALKASFATEVRIVRGAMAAAEAAGWFGPARPEVLDGPDAYLFGEETALLEVLDGRPPFPRIAPPFRHGVASPGHEAGEPGAVTMAAEGEATSTPPTLINNVETFANVPSLLAEGPEWFRSVGTEGSPGTALFTVSGATRRAGVVELPFGVPVEEVLERAGGGPLADRRWLGLLPGASHALLPAERFDLSATHEDLRAVGSGLGSGSFIVFDDATDPVAIAHGVARFLAVESCGQCSPCKWDGVAIASALERLRVGAAEAGTLATAEKALATVAEGARCYIGHQHQDVVRSVLELYPEAFAARSEPGADLEELSPVLIAPIADIVDGEAQLVESQATKQPDWTHGDTDSGKAPVELLTRAG